MSVPFADLNQSQIDNNYVFKQIDIVDDKAEDANGAILSTVFPGAPQDGILVIDNNQSTIDPADRDIVVYGNGCVTADSDSVNIIGNNNGFDRSDFGIQVGSNCDFVQTDNSIQIGRDSDLTLSDNNIIIGHQNTTTGGTDNVKIGNAINCGAPVERSVIITHRPLPGLGPNVPASAYGTVIVGGGFGSSALPKFQLLSPDMEDLKNDQAVAGQPYPAYTGAAGFNLPAQANGWMRMKYQDSHIRIPIYVDSDTAAAPALVP